MKTKIKQVWCDHFGEWECPECGHNNGDYKQKDYDSSGEYACESCGYLTEILDDI